MSDAIRQSKLFAAENWKVVAQSFRNAEFKSYDFDTLRTAMLDIIKRNYPEDFNDYIQSSEFVALIDLIAFVGQNLSFRNDLNSREAFLDTAERRDSILKLARQLSYQPRRSRNAVGYLKIKSASTSETILDSLGNDLSRQTVYWTATTDTDAYEKFVLVMNTALNPATQFGSPEVVFTSAGGQIAQYGFSSTFSDFPLISFNTNVGGKSTEFELLCARLLDNGGIEENTPSIGGPFNVIYKNDGLGNLSPNTGFFMLVKQGTLSRYDYIIDSPLINRVIDIPATNVTENDIWVQSINEAGEVLAQWQRVPSTNGSNLYINDLGNEERNIYEVLTGNNDAISIKFADGNFGNIPTGLIRVIVRTGNGLSYTIKPSAMKALTFAIPYTSKSNQQHTLTITCDLDYAVTNAETADSIEDVRTKAPAYYYAQDRMITGQDYASYPMTVSPGILKIKSINRVHSGMSRYIQDKDPTGTYNDVDIFGTDGFVYREDISIRHEFPYPSGSKRVVDIIGDVESMLSDQDLVNFYYKNYPNISFANKPAYFNRVGRGTNYCHGFFTNSFGLDLDAIIRIGGASADAVYKQIRQGAVALVEDSSDPVNGLRWVPVGRIYGNGLGVQDEYGISTGLKPNGEGVVILNKVIADGSRIVRLIPAHVKTFTTAFRETLKSLLGNFQTFGIAYDYTNYSYKIINADNINQGNFSLANAGNTSGLGLDSSWLMYVTYEGDRFVVRQRATSVIAGSDRKVRFYNENFVNSLSASRTDNSNDTIRYINNKQPNDPTQYLAEEQLLRLSRYYRYEDGYTDPTKVQCTVADVDTDFLPENPYAFEDLVGNRTISLGWREEGGLRFEMPVNPATTPVNRVVSGRSALRFQWHHVASRKQIIDPSPTNIIDTYVLLQGYYDQYREWINSGGSPTQEPEKPTSDDLIQRFLALNTHKSVSDEIIYHPGKFLNLFGSLADSRYRATLKVVKMTGARISDNEIKSRILKAMDEYFNPSNWEFGETFYYTELAAFIHKQLSGNVASVVIVPTVEAARFGNLFQIVPNEDEIFYHVATAENIEIISSITETNIRVNN
jgi:hypothetical protein